MSLNTADKRPNASFACVVLGAGAGRRFGAPKSTATLPDGSTFLENIARTARASGADPVVAVVTPGLRAPHGALTVENPDPFSAQVRSIRLGLARLANTTVEGTLIWPVDCPLVRADTVTTLVRGAAGATIAVPVHHGRNGHPTWFARVVWPELMVAEADGARAVIRRDESRVARVEVDDAAVLTDIDTRDDLARALNREVQA